MSEAIQPELLPYPGEAWAEIVRRPTLEEFSRAFASDVVLEASVLSRRLSGLPAYGRFSRQPAQCTSGSVSLTKSARRRECAWSGKGSSPASRRLAPPSLHGTTAGRSRACDYIIAPSIRLLPLLRRFRGISAEARPQRLGVKRNRRPARHEFAERPVTQCCFGRGGIAPPLKRLSPTREVSQRRFLGVIF
jgi:hypothetical protein